MKMRMLGLLLMVTLVLSMPGPVALWADPIEPSVSIQALGAGDLVDSIPYTDSLAGADDLIAELTFIGQQIAADGRHYPPGANLHNGTNNHFLYTYGRSLFAIAQMLPFLPGEIGDPQATRGAVAAYLRSEIETYMLDDGYFDIEESGSIGYRESDRNYIGWAPPVLRSGTDAVDQAPWWSPSPRWNWGASGVGQGRAGMAWNNDRRARAEHARWEGLLALWAYAHYSGDWIQSHWSTIRTIREHAPDHPVKPTAPEAPATNAWVAGLIAYARLARGVGDQQAESSALSDLAQALQARAGEGVGGDKEFDYTSLIDLYWIEGWDDWTPEFGRWLVDRYGSSSISSRIDSLVTDDRVFLWYESDMSHAHDGENQQQASWISYPIYQAYAAALATVGADGRWTYSTDARSFLRDHLPQPVVSRATPYHRDAYYLQNLVALIRAHGTTRWMTAPADVAATGGQPPTVELQVARDAGAVRSTSVQAAPDPDASAGEAPVSTQGPDNWPQFMHDAQNSGFSRDGLLEKPPAGRGEGYAVENLTLLWKKNIGSGTHGRAQPVVVDNVVYQGFLDGRFLAMDGDTGETEWSFQTGGPITGAAAVSQGRVYFGSWDGRIYCRNAATGAEIWTYDTQDLGSSPAVMRGRIKAPILLVEDTIYVGATNRRFYALDASSGDLRWRYAAEANIESSAAYAKGRVILMTEVGYDPDLPAGKQVALMGIALNVADGSVAWQVPVPGERGGSSYPVVAGDYVLFIGDPADQTPYDIWITDAWEYFGSNSYVDSYGSADTVLRLASEMLQNYPHHRASLVVNVDTGQERLFGIPGMSQPQPIPLGSLYNNWIIPIVYHGQFLFSQFHGLWMADPAAGEISYRFDRDVWMDGIRQEEYHQFVGGLDYLFFSGTGGELYWLDMTVPDGNVDVLIDPDWGHFPSAWADPPSTQIAYLPGQGNGYVEASGYAVPYAGRLYVAAVPGWFYAFQGTYVEGAPDYTDASKTVSPHSALWNEEVTFTISFDGTGKATTVTDVLPDELAYVSASKNCPGTLNRNGATITYSGTPGLDAECRIQIVTRVDTGKRMTAVNTATVDNGLVDPYPVSASVLLNDVDIPEGPDSVKSVTPSVAAEGEVVTFTIAFTGTGELVSITDTLPTELSYVSSAHDCPGSIDRAGRVVRYAGTPVAGAQCSLRIAARVSTGETRVAINTATVNNSVVSPHNVSASVLLNGIDYTIPLILKGFSWLSVLGVLSRLVWFSGP
jgi:uncharacterized repeat protein (TIGR01451 family)